ncbi:glucose-6-phosphate dehydrogenase [Methylobacterium sp. WL69]|uniref:glucose-6-phosphate dehydrogenase n=1 Tax=Methylobacterium sp. WL69 TaxID=2603893 RepID=UPI0011CCCFC1|nr:glucose-6-phosphate dehydrogenase [Methylobacterium sp. WL69]TXM68930.1 glucose-6-phosphate dehydrogenase [Methylobacterium sp. WL69]
MSTDAAHETPPPSDSPAAPPCTLVIFGASGDLTKRLLMPALYNLSAGKLLSEDFAVIGVDHNDNTDEGWCKALSETMQSFTTDHTSEFHPDHIDATAWGFVRDRLHFRHGDFSDSATFRDLAGALTGNVVFYLAVSARFFGPIVEQLGAAGLLKQGDGAFRRVVVEKPFGSDLASAKALNATLLAQGDEGQFFRIDHFLGKETVQSILALRFANGLLEPVWRAEHVAAIEITAAETIGVEERGAFYEPTGALRDMVPNHLFQLLCMVAMEAPDSLAAEAIRDAKSRLLEAIRPVAPGDAVRGQYTAGTELGRAVIGYRAEPNVAEESRTETYVALKLTIDTPRWAGVPFYLRTGKRMTDRATEIAVHFRVPAHSPFPAAPGMMPDILRLRIDPEQGMSLGLNAKRPGPEMRLGRVVATFEYGDFFHETPSVGYETLLYDCMTGDATLFQRADGIEAGWAAVEPLLAAWRDAPVAFYAAGSDGPDEAAALLARDGHAWLPLGDA